jgi:hypothetical protein
MEDKDKQDPELRLEEMKDKAREAANDLIPILMEKAINGKTKDAIHVFEALADRSGFNTPTPTVPQGGPLINLNINQQDMSSMLNGLKTITQTPRKLDSEVQNEKDI